MKKMFEYVCMWPLSSFYPKVSGFAIFEMLLHMMRTDLIEAIKIGQKTNSGWNFILFQFLHPQRCEFGLKWDFEVASE